MKKPGACLAVTIYSTLLLFLSFLSINSLAARTIFTIQSGSFNSAADARKQFDSIERVLNEKELKYLRIENIGRFYAVRLGKFNDRVTAEKFLKANKSKLAGAIIMDAYFIDERIVRLYKSPSLSLKPEKIKPLDTEKDYMDTGKDIRPEPVENQVKTISALVDKKDYESALKLAKSALTARPEEPELNGWYGTVLLKMNYPDKAIKYFKKASELLPNVSGYHNGMGYCLSFLSRFDEAIDEFNKAAALDPANIDALAGLGIAYRKIGKKDNAMDVYNKLKDLDRDAANKVFKVIER